MTSLARCSWVSVSGSGAHAGGVGEDAGVLDAGRLERTGDAVGGGRGVELERGLGAGHLHRRHLAVEVGQGVDQAPEQHEADEEVLPEG